MQVKEEIKVGLHNIDYVSDRFLEFFGDKELGEPQKVTCKVLERDMTDEEIIKEFNPQNTIADVLEFIKTENPTDYQWNLFYVDDFVVNVLWNSDSWDWHVLAWSLDGSGRWGAGDRVFSRSFDTQPSENKESTKIQEAIKIVKQAGYKVIQEM